MREWNTIRATAYGGAIGLAAAAVKSFAPWSDMQSSGAIAKELIGATLAFASVRPGSGLAQFHPAPAEGVGVSIGPNAPIPS